MLNLNPTILAAVVTQARTAAADHPRWLTAIDRAVAELVSNPWIERNADGHGLVIGSTSGNCYSANGVCQCEAYKYNNPCWHRAAARLVRLHDEKLAAHAVDRAELQRRAQVAAAMDQAQQCPDCCATSAYQDRCPAAQISADAAERRARAAGAAALLNECFA